MLASASYDHTVRIWDIHLGREAQRLEGHVDTVRAVSLSSDEAFLASKSFDDTVCLWRCDTWQPVGIVNESASPNWAAGLAFHPSDAVLATLDKQDSVIRIWDLDAKVLLTGSSSARSVHYSNAKVILVGDSGVGKTGLAPILFT